MSNPRKQNQVLFLVDGTSNLAPLKKNILETIHSIVNTLRYPNGVPNAANSLSISDKQQDQTLISLISFFEYPPFCEKTTEIILPFGDASFEEFDAGFAQIPFAEGGLGSSALLEGLLAAYYDSNWDLDNPNTRRYAILFCNDEGYEDHEEREKSRHIHSHLAGPSTLIQNLWKKKQVFLSLVAPRQTQFVDNMIASIAISDPTQKNSTQIWNELYCFWRGFTLPKQFTTSIISNGHFVSSTTSITPPTAPTMSAPTTKIAPATVTTATSASASKIVSPTTVTTTSSTTPSSTNKVSSPSQNQSAPNAINATAAKQAFKPQLFQQNNPPNLLQALAMQAPQQTSQTTSANAASAVPKTRSQKAAAAKQQAQVQLQQAQVQQQQAQVQQQQASATTPSANVTIPAMSATTPNATAAQQLVGMVNPNIVMPNINMQTLAQLLQMGMYGNMPMMNSANQQMAAARLANPQLSGYGIPGLTKQPQQQPLQPPQQQQPQK